MEGWGAIGAIGSLRGCVGCNGGVSIGAPPPPALGRLHPRGSRQRPPRGGPQRPPGRAPAGGTIYGAGLTDRARWNPQVGDGGPDIGDGTHIRGGGPIDTGREVGVSGRGRPGARPRPPAATQRRPSPPPRSLLSPAHIFLHLHNHAPPRTPPTASLRSQWEDEATPPSRAAANGRGGGVARRRARRGGGGESQSLVRRRRERVAAVKGGGGGGVGSGRGPGYRPAFPLSPPAAGERGFSGVAEQLSGSFFARGGTVRGSTGFWGVVQALWEGPGLTVLRWRWRREPAGGRSRLHKPLLFSLFI